MNLFLFPVKSAMAVQSGIRSAVSKKEADTVYEKSTVLFIEKPKKSIKPVPAEAFNAAALK